MKQTSPDVNRILLHGRAAQPPALSHHNHDVDFFTVPVLVSRLSGAADQVNAVISRALLEQHGWLERGDELTVRGSGRVLTTAPGWQPPGHQRLCPGAAAGAGGGPEPPGVYRHPV